MIELYENIPKELKERKQWVVYRKGNKTPVNARTLQNAKSNDETTWSTYDEALATVVHGKADGLGYVFNNDYVAVDLDDCYKEDGKTKEWAADVLKSVYPTYIEKSVSGTGIHIILPRTEALPEKGLNVKFDKYNLYDGIGGFEMYENGRYFILTGNTLNSKCNAIHGNSESVMPYYVKYKLVTERHKAKETKSQFMSTDNLFDEVSRNVSMEKVLSMYGYNKLRHGKMCCPFHNEKTPSFHVYENDFYCFGCQEYGDAIDFVSKVDRISNIEAVKKLAEAFHLNVDLPRKKNEPIELNVDTSKKMPEEIEQILARAYDLSNVPAYNPEKAELVKSGIPQLDKFIGGFEMGKTTVWTGINAAGKSTVLGQAMVECIEQNYNVFAFSGELQAHKFQYWIDLQAAGKDYLTKHTSKLTGGEYYKIEPTAEKEIHRWYKGKFFLYDNQNGMKYEDLLTVMDAFNRYNNCRVFLIDNIMRLDMRNLDRDQYEAQSQFINSISDFAQNRNVHVHVVAHPRKVMGSTITKMDVAGSGDLTNRADNVLAVHRMTPAYQEELRKNLKNNQSALQALLQASNTLEVFKCRDTGSQDVYIPLKYCPDSKRLVDMSNLKLELKRYSWDKRKDADDWFQKLIEEEPF